MIAIYVRKGGSTVFNKKKAPDDRKNESVCYRSSNQKAAGEKSPDPEAGKEGGK